MGDLVRHGIASWPGVAAVMSASVTLSHGISPSVIALTTQPQAIAPDLVGDCIFSDGAATIIIPRCKVADIQQSQGSGGFTWRLMIEDRRWKWRHCAGIAGLYNQPDPTGQMSQPPPDTGPLLVSSVKYIPWTIRTPYQLCKLCLDAMGERGYTIRLPDTKDNLPAVHWDYVNPAQALSSLVNSLGCRVIYRLDTDTVLIDSVGAGGPLPDGSVAQDGATIKLPARPDSLLLIGAPIRYQARFILEAVGREWNGSLKNIEFLTYAPEPKHLATDENGNLVGSLWAYSSPPGFMNAKKTDRLNLHQARDHAKASIFRYYRILNLDLRTRNGPMTIPGTNYLLQRIQQVILGQTKIDQAYPDAGDMNVRDKHTGEPITRWYYDGMTRERPASVYGAHATGKGIIYGQIPTGKDRPVYNTDPEDEVLVPFHILPEQQCVVFTQPVYYRVLTKSASGKLITNGIKAAELILETSFTLRHPITNAVLRCEFPYLFPPPYLGTPPALVHHPDVEVLAAARYNTFAGGSTAPNALFSEVTRVDTNLDNQAKPRADYYLKAEASKYQVTNATSVTYNGLVPIWLDGAIAQVTWSVGSGGAHTHASLNCEHSTYVPLYPHKLQIEYQAAQKVRNEQAGHRPRLADGEEGLGIRLPWG